MAVEVPGRSRKVKGHVTVRLRMRTMKVRLVNGKAVARFRDLGPRDYRVTVDYHGKGPISPAQVVSAVRVRGTVGGDAADRERRVEHRR